jgi:hypothetical protein
MGLIDGIKLEELLNSRPKMRLHKYGLIIFLAIAPNATSAAQARPNVTIVLVDSLRKPSDEAYVLRSANRPDVNVVEVRGSSLTPELLWHALLACGGSVKRHGMLPQHTIRVTLVGGVHHPPVSSTRLAEMVSLVSQLRGTHARTVLGVGHFPAITIELPDSL